MYCLFCDILCIVCVYICTELLPPGGYPIAVKYVIYHIISYHVISKPGPHCRLLSGVSCQGTAIRPAYRPPNPCYLTMSHERQNHAIQAAWHTNPVHLNSLLTIMTRWRRAHAIYRNILMAAYRRAWELCHRVLRKAFGACIWRVSKLRVFFAFLVTCTPRNVAQRNVWGGLAGFETHQVWVTVAEYV
jgi:hypothetical protein